MATALINPDLIQWARERCRLSRELAAEKLKKDPAVLAAWENGDEQPTFSQARDLANKLHVPFGYLFLSERPSDETPLPDLRTRRDAGVGDFSVDFKDVLNDALRKQDWYREQLLSEGAEALRFVGAYADSDDWMAIAADISSVIDLPSIRAEANGWSDFFVRFVRAAEAVGILVLRNSLVGNDTHRKLNPDEFLGFTQVDAIAPLVFVNTADYKASQIFTLAHELAHVWLGESGVSNPDPHLRSVEQGDRIEILANRVAAELLVPSFDFDVRWRAIADTDEAAGILASHYKVSSLVILRQALDAGLVTSVQHRRLRAAEIAKQQASPRSGNGNFQPSLLARSSLSFTMALMAAVSSERTSRKEAAGLLGIRHETLDAVIRNLLPGGPEGG